MIEPEIITTFHKKLVGISMRMSLVENKTSALWQTFMPRRKEISDALSTDLISMQVYDAPLQAGNMLQVFDKWAAVEVSNFDKVPEDMNTYTLVGGLYAVFHYKGLSTDSSIFRYIYGEWLPNSNYVLDQRPHFEVLGPKYKNNDPNSEEEIWVPLKLR
jgi:AraC family transcriptional regulator